MSEEELEQCRQASKGSIDDLRNEDSQRFVLQKSVIVLLFAFSRFAIRLRWGTTAEFLFINYGLDFFIIYFPPFVFSLFVLLLHSICTQQCGRNPNPESNAGIGTACGECCAYCEMCARALKYVVVEGSTRRTYYQEWTSCVGVWC